MVMLTTTIWLGWQVLLLQVSLGTIAGVMLVLLCFAICSIIDDDIRKDYF